MRNFDWPLSPVPTDEIMNFGSVSNGHEERFSPPTVGQFQPYHRSVLKIVVPSTGDIAEIAIPEGTAQPKIAYTTSTAIVVNPNNPNIANTVNIYKDGEELVFKFNMNVPAFYIVRVW